MYVYTCVCIIYVCIFYILLGPWRTRKWQPTPVLLPGKVHGRRRLVGYSPWGRKELDTTEWLHFLFLSFFLVALLVNDLPAMQATGFDSWVGKIPWRRKWQPTPVFLPGNTMDRGAWWATVHGITKSQTWLSNYHFHCLLCSTLKEEIKLKIYMESRKLPSRKEYPESGKA